MFSMMYECMQNAENIAINYNKFSSKSVKIANDMHKIHKAPFK